MLPVYSHLITPDSYGILGVLNSLVAFLPFILTLYYLYGYVRFSINEQSEKLISTFIAMGFILNIFFVLASAGLYFALLQYHYSIELIYFLIAVCALASLFVFQILQMFHRSRQMAGRYIRFSVLYTILGTFFNLSFLVFLNDKVLAMLLSNLITNIIVSAIAFIVMKKMLRFKHISWKLSRQVLQYTIPLVPGAVALLLFSQADKLILFQYVSSSKLGIYTMAFTLGLSMSYLGNALFMSYQPMFYANAAENDSAKLKDGLKHNSFLLIAGLILVLILIKTAYLFISQQYVSGEPFAMVIAVAYSLMAYAQSLELHLTYIKHTSIVSLVYGMGGIINVLLLLWLVPFMGNIGAALSLLLSASIIAVLMYFLAQKYYYVPYDRGIIYGFFSTTVLIGGGILAYAS